MGAITGAWFTVPLVETFATAAQPVSRRVSYRAGSIEVLDSRVDVPVR
jgi:hypothetical protein